MGKLSLKAGNHSSSVIPSFPNTKYKKTLFIIVFLAILAFSFVTFYQLMQKEVILVVNGKEKEVSTFKGTVKELLDQQQIKIGAHDQLSVPLQSPLKDGQKVIVNTAKLVIVQVDGKQIDHWTTAKTIDQVINQLGIQLGPLDKVYPSLSTIVQSEMDIKISRITKKIVTEEENIKYGLVKKADLSLEKNQEKVLVKGQDGKIAKVYEITYEDGKEVKRELLKQDIVKEKKDQIIAYGTASATVSRGGYILRPIKVLKNIKMTHYGSGVYTYTGTTATVGRTIAVDPKIIPLGWWVWIDGVGLRKAEDIGSAIKGNKIDLYVGNDQKASQLGVKTGVTVYVLGPEKPTK
ncbi:3D domain-containing protein [Tepidibacillus sp. HK-1]|uniref:3D domain-containing protein n=1 Tax=Tepidibacillus sp. HK-1 TaxID=1883407 RepID=UPI000852AEDD|nr:3D domain-containing protein [Tepidibacillus sp. HK-1]GBF11412.1 cell wall-binding protein YocH precursor [Tepidibacillus sp. HK-1]